MSEIVWPQRIAKMYASKSGQDHLGLGSVSSDQILSYLSPGINVLTIHSRYHSFYVFLLDEFWRRDRARSSASNAVYPGRVPPGFSSVSQILLMRNSTSTFSKSGQRIQTWRLPTN